MRFSGVSVPKVCRSSANHIPSVKSRKRGQRTHLVLAQHGDIFISNAIVPGTVCSTIQAGISDEDAFWMINRQCQER
jgi:hypothetical protein